jgi:hypothetical protein
MEPIDELLRLYDFWRSLAEEEALAIRSDDWTGVAVRQGLKEALQDEVLRCTHQVETHWQIRSGLAGDEKARVQAKLRVLMDLEQDNGLAISQRRAEGRARQEELNKVTRTLRNVHQHYGSGRSSAWQAYS